MPLAGFYLVRIIGGDALYLPSKFFWFTTFIIIQFTILIPLLAMKVLQWTHQIKSIELKELNERPLPLLIGLASVFALWIIVRHLPYHKTYYLFFITIMFSHAFSFLVSLVYKISLHAVAWGTLIGFFTAMGFRMGLPLHHFLSALILLSSIVLASRLHLKAHSLGEVFLGWGLSFVLAFMVMLVF